jgi:hypothetical protein
MGTNHTRLLGFQFLAAVTMTASMFWHITPHSMEEVSEESNVSIFRAPNNNSSMFPTSRLLICMQPTRPIRSCLWIGQLCYREVTTGRADSNRVKRHTAEMTTVARLPWMNDITWQRCTALNRPGHEYLVQREARLEGVSVGYPQPLLLSGCCISLQTSSFMI